MTGRDRSRPLRAVLLSGHRRHSDRWHDLPSTSDRVASILRGHELEVCPTGDLAHAFAHAAEAADILIVNIARGDLPIDTAEDDRERAALNAYLETRKPIWAAHASVIAFDRWPEWGQALGGRWIQGTSMHPPIGPAQIRIPASAHPVVAGARDFEVWDERYTALDVHPDVAPLAFHRHDGRDHPVLWAHDNGRRVVYDALGHLGSSYDSPPRRRIITQSIDWLLAGRAAPGTDNE